MKSTWIKTSLPHIVAVAVFLALTLIYLYPVLEGKQIIASDIVNVKGMSKELNDYKEATGHQALWTNSMFGGMPAYLISMTYPNSAVMYFDRFMKEILPYPLSVVFLYFIGFYILMLAFRVNPWLSLLGAVGFAFSTYFFIILEAGHYTKAFAIAYMAPTLAGAILIYQGRRLLGGILVAFFLGLEIYSTHIQITYYLGLIILIYGISELVQALKQKSLRSFALSTGIFVAAVAIAALMNINKLLITYEYSEYTMRGSPELTVEKENQTAGLNKDYITAWSYGIPETMTLFIPNVYGGSSNGSLGENSETYRVLQQNNIPNARRIIQNLPLYWGPQPFTSGPVYVGAVIMFLFVLGLLIIPGRMKWWIVAATVLSIMLAWGRHFMALTDLFLSAAPLYNKFRTVSMTLVIAELLIPLLGILALHKIITDEKNRKKYLSKIKLAFYITGGVALVLVLFGGSLFSFRGSDDAMMGIPDWLLNAIREDRKAMLRTDAIRSLIFVALTFGTLWAYVSGKLKGVYVVVLVGAFVLIDLWPVNKRYLDDDDFDRKSKLETPFAATNADRSIMQDSDLYYRVFNLTEAPDKSARTSYFHKNIGGYHGAKLRRYQELIDYQILPERTMLISILSDPQGQGRLSETFGELDVLNMLNTKYFITGENNPPIRNPRALGNAWFVEEYRLVEDPDAEIAALENFDPASEAIVDQRFSDLLEGREFVADSTASIELTHYSPDTLTYDYYSSVPQLVVFSDIYYDKGWNAYIDGEKVSYFRANFILRSMVVPEGQHTIEFRFEPATYYLGNTLTLAGSIIFILALLAVILGEIRKKRGSEASVPE